MHSNVGIFAVLISRVVQPQGSTRCTVRHMHFASLCWVSHRHRMVKVHAADLSEQINWLTSGSRMLTDLDAWTTKTLLISHKPLGVSVHVWNIEHVYFMFFSCSYISCLFNVPSSKLPMCTRKHRGPRALHRHRRNCFSKTAWWNLHPEPWPTLCLSSVTICPYRYAT